MGKLKRGYIQVYTGNGKGKSTAAIGQAVRSAGFGLKCYILQFMKDFPYNEKISLKRLEDLITIKQICKDDWVFKKEPAPEEEKQKALSALSEAKEIMLKLEYDLIILDEVCVSIYFGLIKKEDVLDFINSKPENIELILTGRYCPEEIIEKADLVTDMKEVKHYYQQGIISRKGIDS